MQIKLFLSALIIAALLLSCRKVNDHIYNTTPWEVADSITVSDSMKLVACNDNYLFISNKSWDSVFVISFQTREIISERALKTYPGGSLLKGNVFINPLDAYSFSAYDISDIKNWTLIGLYTGMDQGIPWWQNCSSLYDEDKYYWIGHWNQTLQIFEISSGSVTKHSKFNVGVHSQSISRSGNTLYVANNYGNNRKFDITNPDAPVNMGDFGNSNSNYMGVTASGQIIQNHYSAWGGGTDNIKIYDNGNNTINEINPVADINYSCYTLSSGYCVVWGNPSSVYDIRGGSFKFEANLIAYSTLYNNKYIIAMPHNTIYLINRL